MSKNTSVIEINGESYDAKTGQIIKAVKKVATRASNPVAGFSIDGFTKHKPSAVSTPKKAVKKAVKSAAANEPVVAWQGLKMTARKMHHGAQRSQTLMRSIVHKPASALDITTSHATTRKAKKLTVDPARLAHAKAVLKNPSVQRFGANKSSAPAKTKLVASVGEIIPKGASAISAATTVMARPLPSMVASASHSQLERLLDQALLSANAHKKAWRTQMEDNGLWQRAARVPKWLSIGITIFILLAIGGFFVWQNMPSVSVRIASIKTHVRATTPGYTPSGFSFAGLKNMSSGIVTIEYKDNGNASRTYAIVQEKSNLDSASLVATSMPANFQSSQVKGATVYIYGSENDAAWVSNGIKYTIQDKASLNADQILKIAGSLN